MNNIFQNQECKDRYCFIKDLELMLPTDFYQHYAGNYLGTTTFVWKVPIEINDRSVTQMHKLLYLLENVGFI